MTTSGRYLRGRSGLSVALVPHSELESVRARSFSRGLPGQQAGRRQGRAVGTRLQGEAHRRALGVPSSQLVDEILSVEGSRSQRQRLEHRRLVL